MMVWHIFKHGATICIYALYGTILFPSDDCIHAIYVFAQTSSGSDSGTDDLHDIEFRANGNTYVSPLKDLPEDQNVPDKGDLWKLSLTTDFNVPGATCITKDDIEYIALEESGSDGWRIDSVITILKSDAKYEVATQDMDVNQWLDEDGNPQMQPDVVTRFELNLII